MVGNPQKEMVVIGAAFVCTQSLACFILLIKLFCLFI